MKLKTSHREKINRTKDGFLKKINYMYILSAILSKKRKKANYQYQELNKKHHDRSYKH